MEGDDKGSRYKRGLEWDGLMLLIGRYYKFVEREERYTA